MKKSSGVAEPELSRGIGRMTNMPRHWAEARLNHSGGEMTVLNEDEKEQQAVYHQRIPMGYWLGRRSAVIPKYSVSAVHQVRRVIPSPPLLSSS